jgi:hypothetical protein
MVIFPQQGTFSVPSLFDGDTFGKISGLIDIFAQELRRVIR